MGAAAESVATTDQTPGRSRREIVEAVCGHIIEGERIHAACSKEGITWRTLWFWKAEDQELEALYARARKASGHAWEDKSTRVADEATPETVAVARLQEDNARWRARMADPKGFSDRLDVTSDGESIRPGVVFLPAPDAPLVPPEGGMLIEQTTRVAVDTRPQEVASAIKGLMYQYKQGKLPGSPGYNPPPEEVDHADDP